jgi:hypothetical protein
MSPELLAMRSATGKVEGWRRLAQPGGGGSPVVLAEGDTGRVRHSRSMGASKPA